jgi:hypothetical protein
MHPAIYIDDKEHWNEDYWYLTFTDRFDCWDRDESEYNRDRPPMDLDGVDHYNIFKFSLDSRAIESRMLQNRLLFKMGGAIQGLVACHKSIISAFSSGANGIDITPIVEY